MERGRGAVAPSPHRRIATSAAGWSSRFLRSCQVLPSSTWTLNHDRLGHISIRIELRSGHMPDDWGVEATVMAEVGQFEDIARRAALHVTQSDSSQARMSG